MDFYQSFLSFCTKAGKSPSRVALDNGFSKTIVSGWKSGRTNPTDRTLAKLAEYFGVTVDELVSGEQKVDKEETDIGSRSKLQEQYDALDRHGRMLVDMVLQTEYERCLKQPVVTIRHYLYSPAAGVNGYVSGEDYEDIPLPPDAPDGADYCLTVSGDSMEPYIRDGELVYVKKDAVLYPGDVGVFYVDGATYVKQYVPSYDGSVYLLSANPEREDANVTVKRSSSSSLVVFGKVILKHRLPLPIYR